MKQRELYKLALEKWGTNFQLIMVIEEMAELTKCLAKTLRNQGSNYNEIAEEIADVEIMLAQLRVVLPFDLEKFVQRWKRIKKYRLLKLIKQQEESNFIGSRTIK